jgi:hypothetical protein
LISTETPDFLLNSIEILQFIAHFPDNISTQGNHKINPKASKKWVKKEHQIDKRLFIVGR